MIEINSAHHGHVAEPVEPCRYFFATIVMPAFREYERAEEILTQAVVHSVGDAHDARMLVMRRARTASIELHQFVDRVATVKPKWAVPGKARDVMRWLKVNHLRQIDGVPVPDIEILHDVADAFKHAELSQARQERDWFVKTDSAIISTGTGYGRLGWGEGKYGGVEQVVVRLRDGRYRALSLILKSVAEAWERAMGPGSNLDFEQG